MPTGKNLSPSQIWLLAARPKTLPAAAAPVIVGSAVAFYDDGFQLFPALAAFIAALFIQIGTNLANDVFDYLKGVDSDSRLGPVRVTQAGYLTPRQVFSGMLVSFGIAALFGIYLITVGGWPILVIGTLSIAAGIAYTGGPLPIGYIALGDLFVFIFFGLVAVVGTYYVQVGAVSPLSIWAAFPMGFLVTAIIVINNLRDLENDRKAGKKTVAVLLGPTYTRLEFLLLIIASYQVPLLMFLFRVGPAWTILSWITIIELPSLLNLVNHSVGKPLNTALAATGRLALNYSLLFSIGLVIDKFISG